MIEKKNKQKKKKKTTLASDLYRIYSSDPPIISKKNFNKLNRKLQKTISYDRQKWSNHTKAHSKFKIEINQS